eukprot:95562-Rhodomonas_salina.1
MQIMSVARVMAQHVDKLSLLELTGGSDAVDTRELLEAGANIIVGTPGRLEHTLQVCLRSHSKRRRLRWWAH